MNFVKIWPKSHPYRGYSRKWNFWHSENAFLQLLAVCDLRVPRCVVWCRNLLNFLHHRTWTCYAKEPHNLRNTSQLLLCRWRNLFGGCCNELPQLQNNFVDYLRASIPCCFLLLLTSAESVFIFPFRKLNQSTFALISGIRWLLTKGFNEEAKKILLKASKTNKTSLSEDSLLKLNEKVELRDEDGSVSISSDKKSKKISTRAILQIANISYLWFATIFVYYGLNINAVYLEYWNKYVSFIVSIVEGKRWKRGGGWRD